MEDVSIFSCFIDRCHLFPSWPPSLVCILVEGAQTSPTRYDAWKYIEKWVIPYLPYVFISDSLSMRRNRVSNGSRLLVLQFMGPVELGMEHHTDMAKQWCSCTEPSTPLELFLTSPGSPLTLHVLQGKSTQHLVLCHPLSGLELHKWCWLCIEGFG